MDDETVVPIKNGDTKPEGARRKKPVPESRLKVVLGFFLKALAILVPVITVYIQGRMELASKMAGVNKRSEVGYEELVKTIEDMQTVVKDLQVRVDKLDKQGYAVKPMPRWPRPTGPAMAVVPEPPGQKIDLAPPADWRALQQKRAE